MSEDKDTANDELEVEVIDPDTWEVVAVETFDDRAAGIAWARSVYRATLPPSNVRYDLLPDPVINIDGVMA